LPAGFSRISAIPRTPPKNEIAVIAQIFLGEFCRNPEWEFPDGKYWI